MRDHSIFMSLVVVVEIILLLSLFKMLHSRFGLWIENIDHVFFDLL